MTLIWTKGLFSSTYKIQRNGESIGYFKSSSWSSNAGGVLNEQKVSFKPRGVFSSTVDIFDINTKKRIGEIRTKAFSLNRILKFGNDTLYLFSRGFFSKKWILKDKDITLVEYKARETKGEIKTSDKADDVMILAGLYGINQYYEYIAVVIVITIAIVASQ